MERHHLGQAEGNAQLTKAKVIQSCLTPCAPWTVACQVPLSMEFSRQNTGVGSRSLLQGIFPAQRSNPCLLRWRQILYHLSHQGTASSLKDKLKVTWERGEVGEHLARMKSICKDHEAGTESGRVRLCEVKIETCSSLVHIKDFSLDPNSA